MPSATKGRYRVLVGMNFVPRGGKAEVRLEPGDEVNAASVPATAADLAILLEQRILEPLATAGGREDDDG